MADLNVDTIPELTAQVAMCRLAFARKGGRPCHHCFGVLLRQELLARGPLSTNALPRNDLL